MHLQFPRAEDAAATPFTDCDHIVCATEAGLTMDENPHKQLKKYEKPQVTVISLRPEEAVLGHCKNSTSAGPVSASCLHGSGGACSGHGS
jgi:hypothetical protein